MFEESKQFPKITTGAVIVNKEGKIFLMRGTKFKNMWIIPGGHVDFGETVEDCLVREVKEETGLTIHTPKLLRYVEFVQDPVYSTEKHFISLNFLAYTDDDESAVVLDGREGQEVAWLTVDEILKSNDVEPHVKLSVNTYLELGDDETAEKYKLGWQRALADYKNLQKEVESRKAEWAQMSEQYVLEEFIPVYDNFKKAFAHHPELNGDDAGKQVKNWILGIGYIQKQFWDVLKSHQVEEIKTVGEKLDTKVHEAVGEEEAEGKEPGTILREADGGYVMNGRVIKPAKVIIAK